MLILSFILQVVISSFVSLYVAYVIVDFISFNLLPNGLSELLSNKRYEKISKRRKFAEIGMKTAVAAQQFGGLDKDQTGLLRYKELVGIFGMIKGIKVEQATAISTTVMSDAQKLEHEVEETEQSSISHSLGINQGASTRQLLRMDSTGLAPVPAATKTSTSTSFSTQVGIDFTAFMTCAAM